MLLTVNKLDRMDCDYEHIKWFQENYPQGTTFEIILQNNTAPVDFLHWCFNHLTITEEEKITYYKKVNVDVSDTSKIYSSSNITNSEYIANSEVVINSEYVFDSKKVKNSRAILSSKSVNNSYNIHLSSFVGNSSNVYNGKNITNCNNIVSVTYAVDSSSVVNADQVINSAFVSGLAPSTSKNINDSYFIFDCENVSNCLFCSGIKDKEFYLFNKPINQKYYENIAKQAQEFAKEESLLLAHWKTEDMIIPEPRLVKNMAMYYSNMSEDFWEWVKSLPNYDPMVLYNITFDGALLD